MPPYPSYLPKDENIKHMVAVARKHPTGWHSIEAYRRGEEGISVEKETGRTARRGSVIPTTVDEALVDHFVTPTDDFLVGMVNAQDPSQESKVYKETLSSASTLYAQEIKDSYEVTPKGSKESSHSGKVKQAWLAGEQIARFSPNRSSTKIA